MIRKPTPEAVTFAGILYRDVVAGKSISKRELDLMRRLLKI